MQDSFLYGCSHGSYSMDHGSGVCPMCFPSFSAKPYDISEVDRLKEEVVRLKAELDSFKQAR
jgi:hypothetical protein